MGPKGRGTRLWGVFLAVLGALGALGSWDTPPPSSAAAPGALTPPASIPADCSADVTAPLRSWFAGLGANAVVNLPPHACYLVSDSPAQPLRISGLHGVTVNGNGSTFEQKSYDNGTCGNNNVQPVLWLSANDHLSISDLDIRGPGTCSGSTNEGDYGLLLGQSDTGNSNVTLSGVTIEHTGGDGLAIMPLLGTGTGINWNITFENGRLTDVGYHVLSLEGVNGFTFLGNTVSGFRNFADLEVDNSCPYTGPTSGCYDGSGNPTSTAQWNVSIKGNTFTDATGFGPWVVSEQGACIPQKNLDIENNLLDASVDATIVLTGSGGSCPTDSNLTIAGNLSTAPSLSPCGGSIAAPPACALIEVTNYSGVTISHNSLGAFDGTPTYFPNTLYTPCIALGSVRTATVTGNTCNNTLGAPPNVGLQFPPADMANSGLVRCANTYGLTQPVVPAGAATSPPPQPVTDGACPGVQAPVAAGSTQSPSPPPAPGQTGPAPNGTGQPKPVLRPLPARTRVQRRAPKAPRRAGLARVR